MQIDPDLVDEPPGQRDVPGGARARSLARQGRQPALRQEADILGAVAAGGGIGSVARYGVAELMPATPSSFPWSTLVVNLVGCLLLGVLMVLVDDSWRRRRYVRPFLGIGVLGGFTTYSTMMLDLRTLGSNRDLLLAGGYLVATVAGGLLAVWLGLAVTRSASTRGSTRESPRAPGGS